MPSYHTFSRTKSPEPVVSEIQNEEAPLLAEAIAERGDNDIAPDDESKPGKPLDNSIIGVISVLLVGVFVSQADTSLVLASYATVASEFGKLESGSWLLSSYMLAMCVAQPLVRGDDESM